MFHKEQYDQERYQEIWTDYSDKLLRLLRGEISVEDASTQFALDRYILETKAISDSLIPYLYNLIGFSEVGEKLIAGIRRQTFAPKISIIAWDMGQLGYINNTFGYDTGTTVLEICGEILARNGRISDIHAKIGGDEFESLIPGANDRGALRIFHNLSALIRAEIQKQLPKLPPQTMCAGITQLNYRDTLQIARQRVHLARDLAKKERDRELALTGKRLNKAYII